MGDDCYGAVTYQQQFYHPLGQYCKGVLLCGEKTFLDWAPVLLSGSNSLVRDSWLHLLRGPSFYIVLFDGIALDNMPAFVTEHW